MNKLTELLEEAGIPHARGGEHRNVRLNWEGVDCPYCSPNSSKMLLGLREEYLLATCWQCGTLPWIRTLAELTGKTFGEIRGMFDEADWVREERPRGRYQEPEGVGPLLPAHQRYLSERLKASLSEVQEVERVWSLGGLGNAPALPWRLFLPILKDEKRVSWTTRSIRDGPGAKYHSAKPHQESFPAKSWLYGLDLCRGSGIVCEGPLDAVAVGPGGLATLGVHYSKAQLSLLAELPVLAVCLDAELVAQQRARQLCLDLAVLRQGREVTNVLLETGKDPSRANDRERRQLRRLLA